MGQVVVTVRGEKYLREVKSVWDPVKKRSRPLYVRTLGKIEGEGRNQRIVPSRLHVDELESSQPVGALAMWWKLAEGWGLRESVRQAVGEHADETADAVLALVLNQVTGRRSLDEIAPWIASGPLSEWADLNAETLSKKRLLSALDRVSHTDSSGRFSACLRIQEAAVSSWRGRVGRDAGRSVLYQDVTRVRYNGTHCDWAEAGYGASVGRPHVGFSLTTGRGHHFPILGFPVPGDRPDMATVPQALDAFDVFRIRQGLLVWDRGHVSEENVAAARRHGFKVLFGVPLTSDDAQEALSRWPDERIEQRHQFLPRSHKGGVYAYAWPGRWMGQPGTFAVLLDPARRTRERTQRDAMVSELLATPAPARGRIRQLRASLGRLVVPARGRRGWRLDVEAEMVARAQDGRCLIFTTQRTASASEMVETYTQRDEIEKAFRGLRGEADLAPIRYRVAGRVEAYLSVVSYWAYLLRCAAEWTLRQKGFTLSVEEVVKTLDTIHQVNLRMGSHTRPHWTHVSKEIDQLLRPFGAHKLKT